MDEKKLTPNEAVLSEEIAARRSEAVQNFKMDFSIDDIPDVDVQHVKPIEVPVRISETDAVKIVDEEPKSFKEPDSAYNKSGGCLLKILYALIIVGVSGFLAALLLVFVLDSMAINRTEKVVDVEVVAGSTTTDIAEMLVEKELIDYPFCFRIYSKISGADGKWQVGAFSLSPDMGYATLVETLQTMTPRETVTVTIPEGFTVEEISRLISSAKSALEGTTQAAVSSLSPSFSSASSRPRLCQ